MGGDEGLKGGGMGGISGSSGGSSSGGGGIGSSVAASERPWKERSWEERLHLVLVALLYLCVFVGTLVCGIGDTVINNKVCDCCVVLI